MSSVFLRARASLAALVILSLAIPIAGAGTRTPKPDPRYGDGRVSAFYDWKGDIPVQPGKLLRKEPLEATVGLGSATRQWRILFTSTDGVGGKDPIVVSGALFLPKGTPPAGGWPLVSWGHGTLGGADICAPSWQGRSYRDVRYLNRWLDEGFAVVASDYQGIGVAGANPQFSNRSNAFTLLDSARAVLRGTQGLANRVILVGQSQGGSAVVAAAGYADSYAPDLAVLGAVGTGIVYNPGRPVPQLKPVDPDRDHKVEPTIAYGFYHAVAAESQDPNYKASDVYTDLALPLVDQARSSCLFALEGDVVVLGLTRANTYKPVSDRTPRRAVADDVGNGFRTLRLGRPLFIGAGIDDGLSAVAVALQEDACAVGTPVELNLYPARDHSGAVNESLRDSIPFARRLLAGEPHPQACKGPVRADAGR